MNYLTEETKQVTESALCVFLRLQIHTVTSVITINNDAEFWGS